MKALIPLKPNTLLIIVICISALISGCKKSDKRTPLEIGITECAIYEMKKIEEHDIGQTNGSFTKVDILFNIAKLALRRKHCLATLYQKFPEEASNDSLVYSIHKSMDTTYYHYMIEEHDFILDEDSVKAQRVIKQYLKDLFKQFQDLNAQSAREFLTDYDQKRKVYEHTLDSIKEVVLKKQ